MLRDEMLLEELVSKLSQKVGVDPRTYFRRAHPEMDISNSIYFNNDPKAIGKKSATKIHEKPKNMTDGINATSVQNIIISLSYIESKIFLLHKFVSIRKGNSKIVYPSLSGCEIL